MAKSINNETATENLPAVVPDYSKAMAQFEASGALTHYLNLPSAAAGKWTIGSDKDPVPAGTKVAVDAASFQYGWVYWLAGRPIATVMAPCTEPYPEAPTQTDEGGAIPPAARLSPQYSFTVAFDSGRKAVVRGGSRTSCRRWSSAPRPGRPS
jgi:hypothetical protein